MIPIRSLARAARPAAALLLCAAAFCAMPRAAALAAGAETARPYADLSPGDFAVLEFGGAARITLLLEEKTATGSLWAVIPGEDPSAPAAARMRQDDWGRLTAYLSAEGDVIESYAPHNCERVELLCRYTLTDAEGVHEEQRFSQREGDVWTYSVLRREGEDFVGKRLGETVYGPDGLLKDSIWADLATGEEQRVLRVK